MRKWCAWCGRELERQVKFDHYDSDTGLPSRVVAEYICPVVTRDDPLGQRGEDEYGCHSHFWAYAEVKFEDWRGK